MDNSPLVLNVIELREQFWQIASEARRTVVIQVRTTPMAIFRPFTKAEAQQAVADTDFPAVHLRDVVYWFKRIRQTLSTQGGQAIVYKVVPGGFSSAREQTSFEELLGLLTILTPEQAADIRTWSWDLGKISEYSEMRKL